MKELLPMEEERQELNTRKFTVLTGDKPPEDINWLENLKIYSVFLASEKKDHTGKPISTVDLKEYSVDNRIGSATRLKMILPGHDPVFIWVKTYRFSLAMKQEEVLYYG